VSIDRLLQDGREVIRYDNFSTGLAEFLAEARRHPRFTPEYITLL